MFFIVPNGLNGTSIDSVMLGFIKNEVITVDILVIVFKDQEQEQLHGGVANSYENWEVRYL